MSQLEQASREFQVEVNAEAARLVRSGVPPWDAVIQARQHVSEQRQRRRAVLDRYLHTSQIPATH